MASKYGTQKSKTFTTWNQFCFQVLHNDVWGTVCGPWSNREAAVACRMIGYSGGMISSANQPSLTGAFFISLCFVLQNSMLKDSNSFTCSGMRLDHGSRLAY